MNLQQELEELLISNTGEAADIHALWAEYGCDYIKDRNVKNLLWESLSKLSFAGAAEKECIDLILAFRE